MDSNCRVFSCRQGFVFLPDSVSQRELRTGDLRATIKKLLFYWSFCLFSGPNTCIVPLKTWKLQDQWDVLYNEFPNTFLEQEQRKPTPANPLRSRGQPGNQRVDFILKDLNSGIKVGSYNVDDCVLGAASLWPQRQDRFNPPSHHGRHAQPPYLLGGLGGRQAQVDNRFGGSILSHSHQLLPLKVHHTTVTSNSLRSHSG